jgi:hypothetical protein
MDEGSEKRMPFIFTPILGINLKHAKDKRSFVNRVPHDITPPSLATFSTRPTAALPPQAPVRARARGWLGTTLPVGITHDAHIMQIIGRAREYRGLQLHHAHPGFFEERGEAFLTEATALAGELAA